MANYLQQVSTLHKQNFDLKLELYHRREKQEKLELQLQAAEAQIEEQAELQEVNEQLLSELEKRDQAVEEAVSIIVTLEDKIERLMKEREGVRAFEADYESTYFRPSHNDGPPSSPPQFDNMLRPNTSVPRMPSFLSEQSEGAEALRSLYLPNGHSESTLPKLQEESQAGSPDRMDSPRLSVLSESSFLSVYGEKQLMLGAAEDEEELPKRHRSSSSVEKWIDDRPIPGSTPARPKIKNTGLSKSQFLSINDVMESPLQRLEKLKHTLEKANGSHVSTRLHPEKSTTSERRRSKEILRRVLTDQNSFEQQHALPPTPDTISTDTLRHFKGSNDALFDHRKASGTFLNSTSTIPSPRRYRSDLSLRPRSAGETVTSRREGHGWDTQTEEFTETGSVSSTASTYNGGSIQHPQRAMTPELFTFGGGGDSWGRDMMFNNASVLPSHTSRRYEHVRRSSMVEHPRSDDTVMNYRYKGDESPPTPINPKPFPPDRRSSLSAPTKLKKVAPSNAPTPTAGNSPTVNSPAEKAQENRKSRFTNRFFGASPSKASPALPSPRTTKPASKHQGYFPDMTAAEEDARATPPPIRRNRPIGQRPSSAGGGGYGYDGAADEPVVDVKDEAENGGGKEGGGGRKWFGLGRNNSLRNRN
jgi:hypothetical protein